MKRFLSLALALTLLSSPLLIARDRDPRPTTKRAPGEAAKIQMAILLDTSGSMEGLINQARTQIWKIVNDLAKTKCRGRTPRFEVALYEYGNNSLAASEGYIRQIVPLSENLDLISEKLFELTTNGGDEYCGWVIRDAVHNLEWSRSNDDLKMIFIAGNEPFTQGPIDFRTSCKQAVAKGITVSTIHCGNESDGIQGKWMEGAQLADGSFMNINQDRAHAHVATPYDKKLIELSGQLNTTYLAYGNRERQRRFLGRQEAQDENATKTAPAVAADRAASKASSFYRNSEFDLIDAAEDGTVKLEEIPKSELPAELQKLSVDELKSRVETKKKERAAIQQEIKELSAKRDKYIADETAKGADGAPNLDDAVLESVRKQAEKKNFDYEKK